MKIGEEISDENGWRVVIAVDEDEGGVWTMDKHGAEHFEKGV